MTSNTTISNSLSPQPEVRVLEEPGAPPHSKPHPSPPPGIASNTRSTTERYALGPCRMLFVDILATQRSSCFSYGCYTARTIETSLRGCGLLSYLQAITLIHCLNASSTKTAFYVVLFLVAWPQVAPGPLDRRACYIA